MLLSGCGDKKEKEEGPDCHPPPEPNNQGTTNLLERADAEFTEHRIAAEVGYPETVVYIEHGLTGSDGVPLSGDQENQLSLYIVQQKRACSDSIAARWGLSLPLPPNEHHIFVTRAESPLLWREETNEYSLGLTIGTGETIFSFDALNSAWVYWEPAVASCVDTVIGHETAHHLLILGVLRFLTYPHNVYEEGLATHSESMVISPFPGFPRTLAQGDLDLESIATANQQWLECSEGGRPEVCGQADEEERADCCFSAFVPSLELVFPEGLHLGLRLLYTVGSSLLNVVANDYGGFVTISMASPEAGKTVGSCSEVPIGWPDVLSEGLICVFQETSPAGELLRSKMVVSSRVPPHEIVECDESYFWSALVYNLGEFEWIQRGFPEPYGDERALYQSGACFWGYLENTYGIERVSAVVRRFNDRNSFILGREYDLLQMMAEDLGVSVEDVKGVAEGRFGLQTEGLRNFLPPQICQ